MTKPRTSLPSYPLPADAEILAAPPGKAIWSLDGDEAKECLAKVIRPKLMDGSLRSVGQFHFKKGEEPAGHFITPKADSDGKYYHWLPFDSPDDAGKAVLDWLLNGKPPCDNLVDTHGETLPPPAARMIMERTEPGASFSLISEFGALSADKKDDPDFIAANQAKQADLERNIVVAAYNFRKTDCPSGALLIAMDALDKHLHTVALPNPKGREQIE